MDNLLSNLGNTLGNGLHQGVASVLNFIDSINPIKSGSRVQGIQAQPPHLTTDQAVQQMQANGWRLSSPTPAATSTPQPQAQFSPQIIQQGLQRAGFGNAPVATLSGQLYQAGLQMPHDPWMPTVMALRETQGGRDINDPNKNKNLGANNIFNIRNETGAFQNYPDVKTAILGGTTNGLPSGGFVGLINHTVPTQSDNYADYRKSGKLSDFFTHYSNPTDHNGPIDEQVQNYNWIRNRLTGGDQ